MGAHHETASFGERRLPGGRSGACWSTPFPPAAVMIPIPASIETLGSRAESWRAVLIQWCAQNSGSSNVTGLDAMRALLEAEFAKLPGTVVDTPALGSSGLHVVRVRVRPQAPIQLLFCGHYDTVYGADHAFQHCTQISADRLRGPGVADMKGGLVTMLAALQAFEQTPHAGRVGYEVIVGPDEETGSVASAPLLMAEAPRFQLGLVFEPARPDGSLVLSRKGIGFFTATCHGRAAHAMNATTQGRNAIAALAEFILEAHRLPDALPGVLVNVGLVRGGSTINIVPDFAEARIDVRITKAADGDSVLARLRALAAAINEREGYRCELTGDFLRGPMERNAVSDAAFACWQQCATEVGLAPIGGVHSGGGSDANNLAAAGLPCLDGLGPIGDRLHSPEEWVLLPSIVERAQLAALFLHRLASGEIAIAGVRT